MSDLADTRFERYLAHITSLAGGVEPRIDKVETSVPDSGLAPVRVIAFPGAPEGTVTSFTYGLSVVDYPAWVRGRPELVVTTDGDDLAWGIALGMIVDALRGRAPFEYGHVIDLGSPVVESSPMTGFFLNRPAALEPAAALGVDVGDTLPIHIAGAYPVHPSEALHLKEHGPGAFDGVSWDPFDTTRDPIW